MMRKTDIVRRIHQHTGISEKEAPTVLDGALEILVSTLQKGEPIAVHEFGKFTVRSKAPRTGWNFKTGEAMTISARRVVTFRPSLLLRTAVARIE